MIKMRIDLCRKCGSELREFKQAERCHACGEEFSQFTCAKCNIITEPQYHIHPENNSAFEKPIEYLCK
jgi:predicted amidophosphoribosyltransferase